MTGITSVAIAQKREGQEEVPQPTSFSTSSKEKKYGRKQMQHKLKNY
jgi:hypothetical protein